MERCRDASGLSQPQTRALKPSSEEKGCGLDRRWATSTVARPGAEGRGGVQRRVEIARPPEDVWRLLVVPERWFGGYRETRSRSDHYPAVGARNDHIYGTCATEDVRVTVTRCEPPGVLEEHQEGRTFWRDVVHSLTPSALGTSVRVDDEVIFKGLGRLAASLASRECERHALRSRVALQALIAKSARLHGDRRPSTAIPGKSAPTGATRNSLLIGIFPARPATKSWWIAPRRSGVRVPLAP
jgi:uncharacterized protein YndB with AHSA1/START domain